jgi:hypothetical protein
MVGHVKSHVWLCVSAFSTSTRRARATHCSAERLRRRTIARVKHQEQSGHSEQALARRCREGAVHLEPSAEGRACDGGDGMAQRTGLVRVHPGSKGLERRQDPLERLVAPGPVPRGSQGLAEVGLKRPCQARRQPLIRTLLALQRAQKQAQVAVLHVWRRQPGRHRMLHILRPPPSEAILSPGSLWYQRSGMLSCSVLGHTLPPFPTSFVTFRSKCE